MHGVGLCTRKTMNSQLEVLPYMPRLLSADYPTRLPSADYPTKLPSADYPTRLPSAHYPTCPHTSS